MANYQMVPISFATAQCRQQLERCLAISNLMHHEWAENRLADFNLWSAGLGASAAGGASLDSRLASEPYIRTLIIKLLSLLRDTVAQCEENALSRGRVPGQTMPEIERGRLLAEPINQARRSFSPWSDASSNASDSSESGEVEPAENPKLVETMGNVEMLLQQLANLAVAVRKSGTSSRLQKADRTFDPSRFEHLLKHLQIILLVRGSELGRDFADYQISPHQLTTIQNRLITANLKRRNRFLYAQRHSKKLAAIATFRHIISDLSSRDDPIPGGNRNEPIDESPLELPLREHITLLPAVPTATSASAVGSQIAVEEPAKRTQSQPTMTQITSTGAKINYPRPPSIRQGANTFKCPCCCQTLPLLFAENARWKKHLAEDICPYTCILPDCNKPDVFYITRDAWMNHIQKDHNQCWECLPCSNPITSPTLFDTVDDFLEHTREEHAESIDEDQLATLLSASLRPAPLEITHCPICNESGPPGSAVLLQHIAEHLHSFALRSLPWTTSDKDQDNDGYFDDNNYFDEGSGYSSQVQSVSNASDQDSDGLPSISGIFEDDESMAEGVDVLPNVFDLVVAKATNENLTSENRDYIMDVVDQVTDRNAMGVVNALIKRLTYQNTKVQSYTLELASALSQNCGSKIHECLASESFTNALKSLAADKNTDPKVKQKVLDHMKEWSSQFSTNPDLARMKEAYEVVNSQPKLTAATVSRVRALYDFVPAEPGELAFRKGDIISVLESVYKDWWKGTLRGVSGIFPLNYVEAMHDPTSDDLEREAQMEAEVMAETSNVETLLGLLKSSDDTESDAGQYEEITTLYHSTLAVRPKLIELIGKYTEKHDDFSRLNERLMKARQIYEQLLDEPMTSSSIGVKGSSPAIPSLDSQESPYAFVDRMMWPSTDTP